MKECKHYNNGYCLEGDIDSVVKCSECNSCYYKQLQKKKAEYDVLEDNCIYWIKQWNKLRNKLKDVLPILKYYKDSTLGKKQDDGTYKCELSVTGNNMYQTTGVYDEKQGFIATNIIVYDPRPAIKGVRILEDD